MVVLLNIPITQQETDSFPLQLLSILHVDKNISTRWVNVNIQISGNTHRYGPGRWGSQIESMDGSQSLGSTIRLTKYCGPWKRGLGALMLRPPGL